MTRSSDIDQAPPPPSYSDIGCAVRVLDGEPIKRVRELMNTILDQAACAPPSIRDAGSMRACRGSYKRWHPRFGKEAIRRSIRDLYTQISSINRLRLLEQVAGIYRMGERGRRFLSGDQAILRDLMALRSSKRRGAPPSSALAQRAVRPGPE
jgi:hypothetical protein